MLSWAQRQRTADQQGALIVLQPGGIQPSPSAVKEDCYKLASSFLLAAGPLHLRLRHHTAGTHECLQHAELGAAPEDC